jgi:hypothetical protein
MADKTNGAYMNQARVHAGRPCDGTGWAAGAAAGAGAAGGVTAGAAAGEAVGTATSLETESDLAAGGASVFSAFSQARMLQISGGIANSNSMSRWGFMIIREEEAAFFGTIIATAAG